MRTVSAAGWNVSAPDVDPRADVRSDRKGLPSAASTPLRQDFFSAGCLDLFAEAAMIELQQGVVAFVGRAADAVSDEDYAESMIDRPHDRRRHADVGFRAGHDQRVGLARRPRGRGLSASRQAFMPPHACLLRSLGRHAFRIAPAPLVDHAHSPLHCKVSVARYVSLLWSGRVHGPHPLIIAERPSELIPNAAMFHDASRECPPRDPRILNRSVTGVDEVFRRNQKILPKKRYTMPPILATRLRSEETESPGMARLGEGQ